ncbi:MAG: hypothetical protein ABSB75_07650 [Candidatus Limnocylindrales bacterium]
MVETKSYSGRLRVSRGRVYVNGQPRTRETVEEAKREAAAVGRVLANELASRKLTVRPILCVHRADLPFFAPSAQGVPIVGRRGLVKMLRGAPRVLTSDQVMELARITNARLRPAARPVLALQQEQWAVTAARSAAGLAPIPAPGYEDALYMPPDRRDRLRAALEAQARATDERAYWTPKGVVEGLAPGPHPAKRTRD